MEGVGCDNLNRGVAEHQRGRDRTVKTRGSADGCRPRYALCGSGCRQSEIVERSVNYYDDRRPTHFDRRNEFRGR